MKKALIAACAMTSLVALPMIARAAGAPANFDGEWTETAVHDMRGMDYPHGTPEEWYGGKVMTVAADRLKFADDVCFGPTYMLHRGTLSQVLAKFTRSRRVSLKRDFGVTDAGPFDYLEVQCERGRYLTRNPKIPPIDVSQRDYHPWFLVMRSQGRIDMPFTHGTLIEFSRVSPAS